MSANILSCKLIKILIECVFIANPLFPVICGEGLHGALEFESKFAESPGTFPIGLDPGLGRWLGLLR